MRSFLRTTGILFRAHLLRTLRTRRCLVATLLCLAPVGVACLIALVASFEGPPPQDLKIALLWNMLVQIITPLVALAYGSAVLAEEIEDRTITYLFTRPLERAAILLGRWLAALVPLLGALALSTVTVLAILGRLGTEGGEAWKTAGFDARLLGVVLIGGAVYSALFAAAGALFKRPVLLGLGYTFVYELILGNLPGSNQKATVQYYLRSFLLGGDESLQEAFSDNLALIELAEPAAALRMLAYILAGALLLGAWRLAKREYVLSA
jgi:ABC-type transport system involved in multi-copper enzyme maturation permease subunit